MYEIVVNDDADEELVAAAVFYESREPGLGDEFLHEFSRSLAKIRDRPLPQAYSSITTAVTSCLDFPVAWFTVSKMNKF
jgi:hypothetical protein